MWILKIGSTGDTNRMTIPRFFERNYGWRPGAHVALEYVDDHTIKLTLLGAAPAEISAHLQRLARPHQPTTPPATRPDRPARDP